MLKKTGEGLGTMHSKEVNSAVQNKARQKLSTVSAHQRAANKDGRDAGPSTAQEEAGGQHACTQAPSRCLNKAGLGVV